MPTASGVLDCGQVRPYLLLASAYQLGFSTDAIEATVIGDYIYLDGGEVSSEDPDFRPSNPGTLHPEILFWQIGH